MDFVHIKLPLKTFYLLKEPHQNPMRSFKDLSIHRDRQQNATFFYYVVFKRNLDSIKINHFK